ncbi:hypothetical protein [Fuerstiella marisgermanici]|uniref:Secreted protein n=1 Tax=Fuerstiella marisgermanici TaxID=1891926 RepID=A0A1P8WGS9_9PLAN|nr:hypothetical protein [Fuerstiella marisgermanici]APZ93252.1 hypothetical protein Fuma_02869 [Fuerstiella marisgermanici]
MRFRALLFILPLLFHSSVRCDEAVDNPHQADEEKVERFQKQRNGSFEGLSRFAHTIGKYRKIAIFETRQQADTDANPLMYSVGMLHPYDGSNARHDKSQLGTRLNDLIKEEQQRRQWEDFKAVCFKSDQSILSGVFEFEATKAERKRRYDESFPSDLAACYRRTQVSPTHSIEPASITEKEHRLQYCTHQFGPDDPRTLLVALELSAVRDCSVLSTDKQNSVGRLFKWYAPNDSDSPSLLESEITLRNLFGESSFWTLFRLRRESDRLLNAALNNDTAASIAFAEQCNSMVDQALSQLETTSEFKGVNIIDHFVLKFRVCVRLGNWDAAAEALQAALAVPSQVIDPFVDSRNLAVRYAIAVATKFEGTENDDRTHLLADAIPANSTFTEGNANDQRQFVAAMKRRLQAIRRLTPVERETLSQHTQSLHRLLKNLATAAPFNAENVLGAPTVSTKIMPMLKTQDIRRMASFRWMIRPSYNPDNEQTIANNGEPAIIKERQHLMRVGAQLQSLESFVAVSLNSDPFILSQIAMAQGWLSTRVDTPVAAIAHFRKAIELLHFAGFGDRGIVSSIRWKITNLWETESGNALARQNWTQFEELARERIEWSSSKLGDKHWYTQKLKQGMLSELIDKRLPVADRTFLNESGTYVVNPRNLRIFGTYHDDSEPQFRVRDALAEHGGTVARRNRILQREDPLTPQLLSRQAELEVGRGNLDRADEIMADAIKRQEVQSTRFHMDYADLLNIRARIRELAGNSTAANRWYAEAQAIGRHIGYFIDIRLKLGQKARAFTMPVSVPSSNDKIRQLSDHFATAMQQSNYAWAARSAYELFDLCKSVHGKDSIQAALALSNMASVAA